LTGANTELTKKTVGNLSTAEEFNNIIIRSGKNVRLSDIGSAVLGPENIETKLSYL
jgi:HAE1 family hydrophobic/amphiphilic exporter-1/multidrug efflux pump